jgi:germination protein M
MKRYIVLLLVLQLIFLAGCSLPTGKDIPEPSSTLQAPENTQDNGAVKPEDTVKTGAIDNSKAEVVGIETKTAKIPVTLYYQDADGFLIPLARWIDKQQGIARAAVSGLIDSAITREELQYYGVYPVLPVNTDILGINIKDGVASIDFNKHLLEYKDEASERNVIASVVYTMTEFKTINDVRILVNGFEQKKLKFGTDVSTLLNRSNIAINTQNSGLKNGMAKADIYFFKRANEGFTYLLPVSVECENTNGKATPEAMVRTLLNGKAGDKLQSEMPTGAGLIDSSNKDGVLTLNFDGKFIEYGGNAKEEGLLKQLMYTIKQVNGITKVKILINGKPAELPEGTDVSQGLAIPKTINDVIDSTNS